MLDLKSPLLSGLSLDLTFSIVTLILVGHSVVFTDAYHIPCANGI